MELSGLQIFKYLPAAKKAVNSNCKKCGCPTCMAFALKLAKQNVKIENCPFATDELRALYETSCKQPQNTVDIQGLKIGGENVLYRHEKTFINKTSIAIIIDKKEKNWQEKLNRIENFEITRVSETMKIDLVIFKNFEELPAVKALRIMSFEDFKKLPLKEIIDEKFSKTSKDLITIRKKAILEKDENFAEPVYVYFKTNDDLNTLCAKASYYLCKYANMLVFENFDEALIATLMTLRQNIFTDPQKPLQVESKIYEFNNPDENSLIFMTTNFALTFYAVANELESLPVPSYLIVTPAEGMSVLTAWSAEKFTAVMVAKTLKKFDFASKVKNRKIIIPGLLAHMKEELEEEISNAGLDFKIIVGTIEAFAISDFVKNIDNSK